MEDLSNLTKGQRKHLKKERNKREREMQAAQRDKERKKKKVIKYSVWAVLIIVLLGGFYYRTLPPKNAPIIHLEPEKANLGFVSQAKGTVSTTFKLSNIGTTDLIIDSMDTSCMCTSAAIVKDGVEGLRFGMDMGDGKNPTDWSMTIAPGESATLKVYYDPTVHKKLRGNVVRSVYIHSNDPRYKTKEAVIKAIQTD